MKYIIFTFILFSNLFFSQNKRFIYDYKFVTDSTQKDKVETEQMYLDLAEKGSKYYSRNVFVRDSLVEAAFKEQEANHSNNFKFPNIGIKGVVRYVVEKSYPDFNIFYFNTVETDEYKVNDDREMNWKISPEKDKIGSWEVQKATLEMFGRKWIAWFSTEIPFPDGPYKFHGLPGLIVKISDETNSHSMELKGVKNLNSNEIWKSYAHKERYNPLVNINEKQYKKVILAYRKDPVKGFRMQLSDPNVKFVMKDSTGKILSNSEMLRNREKNAKVQIEKQNNYLELDLLK
ncbi:GLPGLI family protein [Halpernia sp.]|uniref:GLPGLI family protein n=1 Tax=Halpernia sp. TaxID=2782209 RepID=UPI003A9189D3